MNVKIYKNFLSQEECNMLNKITLDIVDKKLTNTTVEKDTVINGVPQRVYGYTKRLSTRGMMGTGKDYPEFVYEISKKIRTFLNIDAFPHIEGHGIKGIITSITYPGGSLYEHKDGRGSYNLPTYRCNVLTQKAEEGCDLYVDGNKVDIDVGDLHCYMASEFPHYATEVKGKIPRIMWMFGAHIPKNYWKEYDLS